MTTLSLRRYHLFQLLRRIDARSGAAYPLGRAPLPRHEPVRLGQQPTLAFSDSRIDAIAPVGGQYGRIDITGFGLFGPDGPLPLHLTEYAHQRLQQDQDASLIAFANIFHHRLITLFYRAWADTRPCVSFDRPDNRRFDHYAASLIGAGSPSPRHGPLPAAARYFMAGHLSRYPRNSGALADMLSYYFAVPVSIRENLFHWLTLPRRRQLRLFSAATAPLGQNCCLGIAIPDRQYSFRIRLGPLSRRQYRQFLPGDGMRQPVRSAGLTQLTQWLQQYLGVEYRWEIQLILAKDHYRGCRLGHHEALGQECWLGLDTGRTDPDDFICRPVPDAAH